VLLEEGPPQDVLIVARSSNGNASIVLPNSASHSRRLKGVFGADELMKVRFRTSATEAQLKRFSQRQEE